MSNENENVDLTKNVGFELHPVTGRIGAEVTGIHLSADLDAAIIQSIREALLKHKVLFFRGQHHIDDEAQEAFALKLGEPFSHPTVPTKQGTNYILELDSQHGGRADVWHTDITFIDAYPQASILRAVVVPEAGGDTVWANTATAYEGLPAELRSLADQLWAVHSNDYDYAARRNKVSDQELARHRKVFASTVYETEHPVVRVHPETGERHLLLGGFVRRFVGLNAVDSSRLYAILQDHVTKLENTVRWRWSAGDIIIWDNRATQHIAINDYGDKHRIVRRVTIAGDVPVGVDGRKSVTRLKYSQEDEVALTSEEDTQSA